jgi:hypothetical protein
VHAHVVLQLLISRFSDFRIFGFSALDEHMDEEKDTLTAAAPRASFCGLHSHPTICIYCMALLRTAHMHTYIAFALGVVNVESVYSLTKCVPTDQIRIIPIS